MRVVVSSGDHAFLMPRGAPASSAATKRVPTHTASAPIASDMARPRLSKMPPAATTLTGPPVSGLVRPLTASRTLGMRMEVGVAPV